MWNRKKLVILTNFSFFVQDKLILTNENRESFVIGELVVPDEFYKEGAGAQTIAHEIGHYADLHHNLSLYVHTQVSDAPAILLHDPANEKLPNEFIARSSKSKPQCGVLLPIASGFY